MTAVLLNGRVPVGVAMEQLMHYLRGDADDVDLVFSRCVKVRM